MKHRDFYVYQVAETVLNTSIRTVGFLFAWLMLTVFKNPQHLGVFIGTSWACQVLALLLFSWVCSQPKFTIHSKKILLCFCVICLLSFLLLLFIHNYFIFGIIFVISSIFTILLNPLGTSLTNDLYGGNNKSNGFKVRGFVNSINTILSPAISGFIIHYFGAHQIICACIILSFISGILFYGIKNIKLQENLEKQSKNTFKILLKNPIERLMVLVSLLANFIITPMIAYIIPYNIANKFKLPAFYIGISEGCFGIGMILGSVYFLKLFNKKIGSHKSVVCSIVLVAIGILLSLLDGFYLFCMALIMMGVGVVMFNINSTHIRCTATPKDIRASFEFIFLACCIVFIPIGVFLTTWVLNNGFLIYFYGVIICFLLMLSVMIDKNLDVVHIYKVDNDKLEGYYKTYYPKIYQ
ncbi:MFS transporter [Moraxella catarrhalis]|uniref:MFS transporter n=2 Tax=Moraxella catarrhalis TaxID=480 RepID=UPI000202A7B8|nr:MFS transporter [Moraxella catarrhalis]EGE27494.1 major facilitator superfamily protein [Moraxella catarrhalis O35E]MPW96898.1 MFS transporter [Moraxella catarrhalis]MPX22856.1 MFS transporter [Moraxella catarrhalis]MPX75847.1 MFS transporter [Moraxella catarrhalis]RKM25106.1 MFS transporter [Moraxella catarrhalis]